MTHVRNFLLFVLTLLCTCAAAHARVWTDATGKYTVDADLIAFDEKTVVLQRADHQLGAMPIEKLSQADRDYLKSEEAGHITGQAGKSQTWTLQNGIKIVGKIVDYAHKDVTIQRRRGRIYVNDRPLDNLPEIYQRMLPQIVAHFDPINQVDRSGLESWAVRQRGQARTFTLDGVTLELENGDEYSVPFFLFSEDDLKALQPGWKKWLAAHDDFDQQQNQAFLLQAAAAARARDQQVDRQIALMQLNLQAVQAGLTSVWEVTLYPNRGNPNPPMWVTVFGRNSQDAANAALQQNPGFSVGPIRRVSG